MYTAMQSKLFYCFTSMSVTEFCVKCFAGISCSYFPVINSVPSRISSVLVLHLIICFLKFLGRFIWSKSPLLSLLCLIFRLSIYNCHHPIQHQFLSITILSSESPSRSQLRPP